MILSVCTAYSQPQSKDHITVCEKDGMLAESWVQGQLDKDICWMVVDDLWRIFVAQYGGRSLKAWHRNGASVAT